MMSFRKFLEAWKPEVYYWRSSQKTPVNPGFVVPVWTGIPGQEWHEEYVEKIRREDFPNKPPRIGSVFVCPDFVSCVKWADWKYGRNQPIYKVSISGKTHLTDANSYNQVGWAIADAKHYRSRGDENTAAVKDEVALQAARDYWTGWEDFKGLQSVDSMGDPEIIVRGTVTVLEPVSEEEIRAAVR